MQLFESAAENTRTQSQLEVLVVAPRVTNISEWIGYANQNYQTWVEEGHQLSQGNLNRLNPINYHGYLTERKGGRILRDDSINSRVDNYPFWSFSPPPATFGILNYNFVSDPDFEKLVEAALELQNETCTSPAFGESSVITQALALTPQEHARIHNDLPSSSKNFPHLFFVHPIQARIEEPGSLVALAIGMASWDVALRDLLPVGVEGINAVIRNTCDQVYTYEISGTLRLHTQGPGLSTY